MNRFKFDAYKAEFPFAFVDDLNVSYLRSEFVDIGNSLFSQREDTKVSIFDEKGKCLGSLTASRTVGSIGVQHQPDAESDNMGETLLEWCFAHQKILDSIEYVVEDSSGFDSTRDDREWRTITIYKLPKGHTLKEFVDAAAVKAKAEVRKESTF